MMGGWNCEIRYLEWPIQNLRLLLLHVVVAVEIVQVAALGQAIVMVAIDVDGGVLLGALLAGVREPSEQIIVLELGG